MTFIDKDNQVYNIRVKNVIINNIEVNNSYEFVYRSYDRDNSIEAIINERIVNIIRNNKDRDEWVDIINCK